MRDCRQISNVSICQDENWGETTTAVTNTSDIEYAMEEELSKWQITPPRPLEQRCRQHLGPITSATLALAAFLKDINGVGKTGVVNPGHLFGQVRTMQKTNQS